MIAKLEELAVHVARGGRVAAWAKAKNIARRTAYRWAGTDEFKGMVEVYRRRMIDGLVGRVVNGSERAARELTRLMDDPSAAVRLSACRAILDRFIPIAEYADIEKRIQELERRTAEQSADRRR